jgi:hypothetical protein
VRHYDRDLAIADDPGVLSPLRIQANLVAVRLHRDRDLVGDLQRARQHREGGVGSNDNVKLSGIYLRAAA